jgi:hypothetical protein
MYLYQLRSINLMLEAANPLSDLLKSEIFGALQCWFGI